MADGRHLWKIAISVQRIDSFWWILARWCNSPSGTPEVIKFENFWNPRWWWLPSWKIEHLYLDNGSMQTWHHYRTLIGSHVLLVTCNHWHAASTTGSARNCLWCLLTSAPGDTAITRIVFPWYLHDVDYVLLPVLVFLSVFHQSQVKSCWVFISALVWFVPGVCTTSPHEPPRGGGGSTECRATALRSSRAGQTAASSEPVAADQGRRWAHPQPGAVSRQSCTAARARSNSAHSAAAAACTSGHCANCELFYLLTFYPHLEGDCEFSFIICFFLFFLSRTKLI